MCCATAVPVVGAFERGRDLWISAKPEIKTGCFFLSSSLWETGEGGSVVPWLSFQGIFVRLLQ